MISFVEKKDPRDAVLYAAFKKAKKAIKESDINQKDLVALLVRNKSFTVTEKEAEKVVEKLLFGSRPVVKLNKDGTLSPTPSKEEALLVDTATKTAKAMINGLQITESELVARLSVTKVRPKNSSPVGGAELIKLISERTILRVVKDLLHGDDGFAHPREGDGVLIQNASTLIKNFKVPPLPTYREKEYRT